MMHLLFIQHLFQPVMDEAVYDAGDEMVNTVVSAYFTPTFWWRKENKKGVPK